MIFAPAPPPALIWPDRPQPASSLAPELDTQAAGRNPAVSAPGPLRSAAPDLTRATQTAPLSGVRPAGPDRAEAFLNGRVYPVVARIGFLSVLELRPGETIVSTAAGDTAGWVVGETGYGKGPERRSLVLIKPLRAGLATNIVVATDERVYLLQATSRAAGAFTDHIAFTYPGFRPTSPTPAAAEPSTARLNFGYRVDRPRRGHAPSWTPDQVWDDGRRTFIQFPRAMAAGDAPPLFLKTAGGADELMNYRIVEGVYVVDRLFDRAEFRLGADAQERVDIVRVPAP